MINFQFFPRSHGLTPEMKSIVDCFVAVDANKNANAHLKSNDMLALLRPYLESLHFSVETGKKMPLIDVNFMSMENPKECNYRFREILRGMKIDDPGDYLPSLPQYFMRGKSVKIR